MSNISEIQSTLLSLIEEIEDNDGEITPEQEEQLSIAEEALSDKINDYNHVITILSGQLDTIDDEIYRLEKLQERKVKIVKKLKEVILGAVLRFGSETKSGTRCIDTGLARFSTRKVQKIQDCDDKVYKCAADAAKEVMQAIKFVNDGTFTNITKKDLLSYINRHLETYKDEDDNIISARLSEKDLDDMDITFSIKIPASQTVTENGIPLINSLSAYAESVKVTSSLNKTELKNKLKDGGYDSNLGVLETNYSLQIK